MKEKLLFQPQSSFKNSIPYRGKTGKVSIIQTAMIIVPIVIIVVAHSHRRSRRKKRLLCNWSAVSDRTFEKLCLADADAICRHSSYHINAASNWMMSRKFHPFIFIWIVQTSPSLSKPPVLFWQFSLLFRREFVLSFLLIVVVALDAKVIIPWTKYKCSISTSCLPHQFLLALWYNTLLYIRIHTHTQMVKYQAIENFQASYI